jgi:hypothetical protein
LAGPGSAVGSYCRRAKRPEARARALAEKAQTPQEAALILAKNYERPAAWALQQSGPRRAAAAAALAPYVGFGGASTMDGLGLSGGGLPATMSTPPTRMAAGLPEADLPAEGSKPAEFVVPGQAAPSSGADAARARLVQMLDSNNPAERKRALAIADRYLTTEQKRHVIEGRLVDDNGRVIADFAKPEKPTVLSPGSTVYDAKSQTGVYTAPAKDAEPKRTAVAVGDAQHWLAARRKAYAG